METSFLTGKPIGTCVGKHDLKLGVDAKAHIEKGGVSLLIVIFQRRAQRATVVIDFMQDIDKAARLFTELHPDFKLVDTQGTTMHFSQDISKAFNLN